MQSTLDSSLFTQITPSEQEALSGGGKSVKVIIAKVSQKAHATAVSFGKGDAVAYADNYSNISID